MSGIYIHIPFCKQACTYCDFYFETSLKHRADFVKRLISEMELAVAHRPAFTGGTIDTIYLGGGTPSRLDPSEISEILSAVKHYWRVSKDAEITIEMNPDDVDPASFKQWMDSGINRISMGIQTFNPDRLKFMNRAHSREEAHRALKLLQESGCRSWTADLIYGNPGQSDDDLRSDIRDLLKYNPPHVSAYSLTVEPNTRLGNMVRKEIVKPAEDDVVSRHMQTVTDELAKAGIRRYEVSNFAIEGHESRHNSAYWTHTNYLGLGPSAHSFWWDDDERGGTRWSSEGKLAVYMKPGVDEKPVYRQFEPEFLNAEQLAEERLFVGLRTVRGVSEQELKSRYDYELSASQREWLKQLREQGYVMEADSKNPVIQLTDKGMMMADYIALNLISRG